MLAPQNSDIIEKDFMKYAMEYFEEKNIEQYYINLYKSIKNKNNIGSLFICQNPKTQFGQASNNIMNMLHIIRDDAIIFQYLVGLIDRDINIKDDFLDTLSNDIINFLLIDFDSPTDYVLNCLSKLIPLFPVIFKKKIAIIY